MIDHEALRKHLLSARGELESVADMLGVEYKNRELENFVRMTIKNIIIIQADLDQMYPNGGYLKDWVAQ